MLGVDQDDLEVLRRRKAQGENAREKEPISTGHIVRLVNGMIGPGLDARNANFVAVLLPSLALVCACVLLMCVLLPCRSHPG